MAAPDRIRLTGPPVGTKNNGVSMRLPETRYQPISSRSISPLIIILAILLLASLIGALVIYIARSESPLFALWDKREEQTALESWKNGDYNEVIEILDTELNEHPMNASELALRGFSRFYLAMEQVDTELKQHLINTSIQDLRRALLDPNVQLKEEIHFILGKAYFQRGEYFYDSAVIELQRALELGFRNTELLEYLGIAYRELGQLDEARRFLSEAAEESGENLHYLAVAAVEERAGNYAEAGSIYRKVAREASEGILIQKALLGLGNSQRKMDQYEEAMKTYSELIELNPSSADAHYGLGEAYLEMEQMDRARYEWREALRLDPNHVESFTRLQEY